MKTGVPLDLEWVWKLMFQKLHRKLRKFEVKTCEERIFLSQLSNRKLRCFWVLVEAVKQHYEEVLELAPEDAQVLGNYIVLLVDIYKMFDGAE